MRYRDAPTVEVCEFLEDAAPERVWELVTDITLPTRVDGELTAAHWVAPATGVAVGARFHGINSNDALGRWESVCEVVEVEPGRRWVWTVGSPEGGSRPWATWAFEVDPTSRGTLLRQWARLGPGRSGLSEFIEAAPDKEGQIIFRRMETWRRAMQANLDWIKTHA